MRTMSRRRRHAFTLVELLVVIGIIALLISILLPTLNQARASGQAVVCLSNIRQLWTVTLMYADDNDGSLPYAWSPAVFDSAGGQLVNRTLRIYMDMDHSDGGITRTYECPALAIPLKQDDFYSTYAVNLGTFIYSPPSVVPQRPAMKLTAVPRPTQVVAFADANQTKNFFTGKVTGGSEEFLWYTDLTGDVGDEAADGFVYQPQDPADIKRDMPLPIVNNVDKLGGPGAIRYRHGTNLAIDKGRAGVVFHDGHAEMREVGELTQKNIAVSYD